ncbi:uncharacterized protein LOC122506256 [Leptopilina heterotoma]|uniref:uncharacterized protein LOC122506256 n=1 Tax=Leptopilina heterotoma TaxID=63436 RepID=UPI001CA87290|nr:uncharacterized protein LOC122506256 [Leptopilina heterotoma]
MIVYCSDEQLDAFSLGDNTIKVTLAVLERTINRRETPNSPVRYILSNLQNRKLRLVVWKDLHKQYEGKLLHKTIKISRGKIIPASASFYRKEEGLMPIEISIQDYTKVEVLGDLQIEDSPVYAPMEMKDVGSGIGKRVNINAYIKMKIEPVVFNNSSYGCGSITDLHYKLIVNVSQFNNESNHEEGRFVSVKGTLRENEHKTIVLQVTAMHDIEDLNKSVTEEELDKGFRTPPRVNTNSEPSANRPMENSRSVNQNFVHQQLSQKLPREDSNAGTSNHLPNRHVSVENSLPADHLVHAPSGNLVVSPCSENSQNTENSQKRLFRKEDFPKLPSPKKIKNIKN